MSAEIKGDIDLSGIEAKSFPVQVDAYSSKYLELREKISIARKEGKDVYIAELHIMRFKAKLHIAEVTRTQKDLDTAREILIRAEREFSEAHKEKIINVKEEVEEGAKKLIEADIKNS